MSIEYADFDYGLIKTDRKRRKFMELVEWLADILI